MGIQGQCRTGSHATGHRRAGQRLLNDIKLACQRAAGLTQQLLAYAGKGKYLVESLNLSSLVSRVDFNYLRAVVSKKAELRLDLDEDLPDIEATRQPDPADRNESDHERPRPWATRKASSGSKTGCRHRLNADYIPSRFRKEPLAPGRYVAFTSRTRVAVWKWCRSTEMFDPFFTTKFMGRGLGLSAVQGIRAQPSGRYPCGKHALGRGTKIRVIFPAQQKKTILPLSSTQPVSRLTGQGHGTILIVDDEPPVLKVTTHFLELMGYHVLTASDGKRA